jgi:hypothetical protein
VGPEGLLTANMPDKGSVGSVGLGISGGSFQLGPMQRGTGGIRSIGGLKGLSYGRWNYWCKRGDDKSSGVGGRDHRTMFANPPTEDVPCVATSGGVLQMSKNIGETDPTPFHSPQHHPS